LPTLVLALVLAQLVHEAGHALAAALDDVAPSKLQFSIHAIIPSASVVFPSSVDYLPTRARARIATSGPWHNLILWGCLLGLGWLSPLLWADYSAHGRVVTSIAPVSSMPPERS
jgi:S2P endopeptidase